MVKIDTCNLERSACFTGCQAAYDTESEVLPYRPIQDGQLRRRQALNHWLDADDVIVR